MEKATSKKGFWLLAATLSFAALLAVLGGCAAQPSSSAASSSSSEAASSEGASSAGEPAESLSFEGELIDAQNNRLVVRGDDETMLFTTTEATVYDLQDQKSLTVGDTVKVDNHKGEDAYIADTVHLVKHVNDSLVFGGQVTELTDIYLTVQSESLSVVFARDDKTKIEGNLTIGDSVTVTYEGDLSENPRAISIVVVKENKESAEKSISGTVSEVSGTSIVISIGSAHAARFIVSAQTKITGDDTTVKVGDRVHVVYEGTVGNDPAAKVITIHRDTKTQYFVMDGVIDDAASNKIVILTSKKSYTFNIVADTRIQNREYMAKGHKTTITYVGNLDENPTAASIFCSKDTVTEQEKSKSSNGSAATKPSSGKKSSDSSSGGSSSDKTTPSSSSSASPTPSDEKSEAAPEPEGSGESTEPDQSDESTEPDQFDESAEPEGSDESTEPDGSDESTEPEGSDESTEPEQTDESTEPEQSEEATESETEPEQSEAAPEPEEEPEEVSVKAKGEIIKWGKNPSVFKIEGGATIKLDIKKAEISGGYIPQKGDQVIITYDKDNMKLLDLQLEYRPADDDAVADADEGDAADAGDEAADVVSDAEADMESDAKE